MSRRRKTYFSLDDGRIHYWIIHKSHIFEAKNGTRNESEKRDSSFLFLSYRSETFCARHIRIKEAQKVFSGKTSFLFDFFPGPKKVSVKSSDDTKKEQKTKRKLFFLWSFYRLKPSLTFLLDRAEMDQEWHLGRNNTTISFVICVISCRWNLFASHFWSRKLSWPIILFHRRNTSPSLTSVRNPIFGTVTTTNIF